MVHVIAGTLSALSLVENPFFKKIVNILDPRYELPSRKQLSTKHFETVYLKVESNLRESENDDFNVELPDDNFPTLGHCFVHTLQLVVKDGLKEIGSSLKQ